MSEQLRQTQQEAGAIFAEGASIPLSFNNDRDAIAAAREGTALCDRSHWGLIRLTGEDRASFVHNQTTNNINSLQVGHGCETVFVSSTGRTLDLASAYVTEDALILLVSPNTSQSLIDWMDRFIFPFDKVELADISSENAIFTLIGSASDASMEKLGIEWASDRSPGSHQLVPMGESQVRVAVGSGLALPGYTFIVPIQEAVAVWKQLTATGAVPLGDRAWEALRIQQGRPMPGRELTEDYNPLEAGLWQAVSFDKGCYIGQETIARLNTYKGVKQRLWGIELKAVVEANTPVTLDGNKVGILTSCTATEAGALGLAYVRTKAGGAGLTVQVASQSGELIKVPFLTHE